MASHHATVEKQSIEVIDEQQTQHAQLSNAIVPEPQALVEQHSGLLTLAMEAVQHAQQHGQTPRDCRETEH
jgi:hypothetical protein